VDHSDDAAEVGCRAVQFVAGVALDAPDDVQPTPAEHKHMVRATAAYIRSKGWQATAGIGLALMFGAWLLKVLSKPRPMSKVRGWLHLDAPAPAAAGEKPTPGVTARPAGNPQSTGLPPGIPPLAP
jgi:hypothetical protein